MQQKAALNPDAHWMDLAMRLSWFTAPTQALNTSGLWFEGGKLNACYNAVDRHLEMRGDQLALIWQGEAADEKRELTYRALHQEVCRMANVLLQCGVKEGDRVAIHLPAIAEGVIAMLACARIGAIHVVLFGGFSAEAIADRIADADAKLIITADVGRRGPKRVPFKKTIDAALTHLSPDQVETILVMSVTHEDVPMQEGRDHLLAPLITAAPDTLPCVTRDANDPLFLLYTSGSTGKPKGIVHGTGGYLTWASFTQNVVFDHREGDVFWCTADLGWITGHSYVAYGPLCNGGTILIYEGMPSYPDPGQWWRVIEKYRVTSFYTSPTAIRALMREGDDVPGASDLNSLRVLGSVGEPISREAWEWFYRVIGRNRCHLVDTWWQTETGGIMISPVPGIIEGEPSAATLPLPGIDAVLLGPDGQECENEAEGVLCMRRPWPGRALSIWRNDELFQKIYLAPYPGYYFTGDGARRDGNGHYWITGRVDDVINVSGHRIGSAEIEDVLADDRDIAECAAIGIPHSLKGQAVVVFIVPKNATRADMLPEHARQIVSRRIGRYAVPEHIYVVDDLPKTRSGKNVRRLLRKIASGEKEGFGDLSTLSDPDCIERLLDATPM
ncbi:acetate--CoA ligase [Candidatus Kirkpatrickella diaphorinae]|uniref:Acetate--CoA ligase n=2 Tax=Candidatus Kirkpatrickella diaphorinae TaxID=2984322 RepID=A0ABY6GNA9_9PROT|nr:acetate--CoA ligase [Candidatus Kirkpatrickella diaphorinae]UYH52261.1 acetate--CoA ligase [Candidatus Kirkpatrickella diaphorinae]